MRTEGWADGRKEIKEILKEVLADLKTCCHLDQRWKASPLTFQRCYIEDLDRLDSMPVLLESHQSSKLRARLDLNLINSLLSPNIDETQLIA